MLDLLLNYRRMIKRRSNDVARKDRTD